MIKLLAACIVSLFCLTSAAQAAWVVTQVTSTQVNPATSKATAAISIAQNHLIVVSGIIHNSSLSSVTDQAGNTYNIGVPCQRGANSDYGFIAWAIAATALSSQTITVNAAGSATIAFGVADVTGFNAVTPEDTTVRNCAFSNATTATPSVTSNAPTQSGDLFFSVWAAPSTATGLSFTAGGSWIPPGGFGTGNTSSVELATWFDATGSGTTQTNNPATTAKTYMMPITAFNPASAGSTPVCSLASLGVGDCLINPDELTD